MYRRLVPPSCGEVFWRRMPRSPLILVTFRIFRLSRPASHTPPTSTIFCVFNIFVSTIKRSQITSVLGMKGKPVKADDYQIAWVVETCRQAKPATWCPNGPIKVDRPIETRGGQDRNRAAQISSSINQRCRLKLQKSHLWSTSGESLVVNKVPSQPSGK